MSSQKHILYITGQTVTLSIVNSGKTPAIKKKTEKSYTRETLATVTGSLLKQESTKSLAVVLGDEVSYVLKGAVPKIKKDQTERQAIFALMQEQVPEDLTDQDWDYSIHVDPETKKSRFFAFAPVKSILLALSTACQDAQCGIRCKNNMLKTVILC